MVKRLSQIEVAICVVLLAIITALVFVAAITRFFGYPLPWSVDLAQLLFIWTCFLGADKAMRDKTHLGMEIPIKYLPYKYRFAAEVFCTLIMLAFLAVMVVKGIDLTILNKERLFGDSNLSYAWVTAAVPVGSILLGLSLIYNMVDAWRRRAQGALVYNRTEADKDAVPPPLEL
ncbi:MAG: TRAP transporter small permease [Candidatus Accumulibacter sp.]|jgi:TRAP-type C4-dicarboxylate transport system permease small subunit|nr:TRAP transporter small permease [Accumulibacter sp.]